MLATHTHTYTQVCLSILLFVSKLRVLFGQFIFIATHSSLSTYMNTRMGGKGEVRQTGGSMNNLHIKHKARVSAVLHTALPN